MRRGVISCVSHEPANTNESNEFLHMTTSFLTSFGEVFSESCREGTTKVNQENRHPQSDSLITESMFFKIFSDIFFLSFKLLDLPLSHQVCAAVVGVDTK